MQPHRSWAFQTLVKESLETLSPLVGFMLAVFALGVFLYSLPFSLETLETTRFKNAFSSDRSLKDTLSHCGPLEAESKNRWEISVLERLGPLTRPDLAPCQIQVSHASFSQFGLLHQASFRIQVVGLTGQGKELRSTETFSIKQPLPLALLPLGVFLLAIAFGIRAWGIGVTLFSLLVFIEGGNLIQAFYQIGPTLYLTWKSDSTLPGTLLIALWLALYRSHRDDTPLFTTKVHVIESPTHRLALSLIGFWSPAFYTLLGRLIYPLRSTLLRLSGLLNGQFLIACLSLYLLSLSYRTPWEIAWQKSLALPRYFTFAAFFLIFLTRRTYPIRRHNILWRLPGFWKAIAAIAVMELVALSWAPLKNFPTLTRMGLALLCSEFFHLRQIRVLRAFHHSRPLFLAVLVASFFATLSRQSGLPDLIWTLLNPASHPSILVACAFLAGMGLGFVCGGVTASFFAFFSLMMGNYDLPLVRAALIDGVVAGIFFSPFSIFNVVTAAEFKISVQQIIASRFEQLGVPVLIALVIYTLSAVNSVAVLRPATFVFLCLVVATVRLKKAHWRIRSITFQDGKRLDADSA